ncbi:MAG: hypothetical protein IT285_07455, partial [Bdellovibrionales bacterium]|nr:hypothetical protein [Bdellovibrionales bacterium]
MTETISVVPKELRVLVVDESAPIRSSVARILTELGVPQSRIETASGFKDAAEAVGRQAPNLLI